MRKRLSARVRGRVQAVGFRFFVCQVAEELGLVGFVRNTPDGAVEVVAEGEQLTLEKLLEYLKEGPRAAHVTQVDASWEEPTGRYDRFLVKA